MAPSRGVKRSVDGQAKMQNGVQQKLHNHRMGDLHGGAKSVLFDETSKSITEPHQAVKKGSLKDRARELLSTRQQLPIWSHADDIRAKLRSHDVLLLVGETGSGKSTQIPQFLVNEKWCRRKTLSNGGNVGGCIAITQPRRVAAMSLARRVAEEFGTPLGNKSPASEVGYSVRFDNSTSPSTRIKFLTEGMLLQEMLRDPWLKEYSAVIVDEVHERDVNVDLVLGFLRKLQEDCGKEEDARCGSKIKVVIMSATADMEKMRAFFDIKSGKPDGVEDEWEGFSGDEKTGALKDAQTINESPLKQSTVASVLVKGRQYPVQIHYTTQPVNHIVDASLQRIMDIHPHEPLPGDILVFLTGQEFVESLLTLVNQYAASLRNDPRLKSSLPDLLVLPLYAALPSNMQQRVFEKTPPFTRKVIIATNIAETSITVPGVRHVIDCGKHKQRKFRPSLGLDVLLSLPISRSNANQRSGRAGRDAPGHAYRLYTEKDFYTLSQDTEPEIMRCDLSQTLMILKSHGINKFSDFPLLSNPSKKSWQKAIIHLLQMQALDGETGEITSMGREMSLLPLPVHLARILLASSDPKYDCVEEMIDIVSVLSGENIFRTVRTSQSQDEPGAEDEEDDDENPRDPRLQLRNQYRRREGDHLTLLATVQGYVEENSDRKRWCEDRAISHRAMQAAMDVRKQLTALMKKRQTQRKGMNGTLCDERDRSRDAASDITTRVLKCLLTGLHPNVARLSLGGGSNGASKTSARGPSTQYSTLLTDQTVWIHPSSVLAGRKVEAIMYSEYVHTTKPYARCVSAIELPWITEV